MKHSLIKFASVSTLILVLLGGVSSDQTRMTTSAASRNIPALGVQVAVEMSESRVEKAKEAEERRFGFEFPNIFNVFRSLF